MSKIMKSKRLISTLLMTVVLSTGSLAVSATTQKKVATWPQFRGDSLSAGITDSKTPITKSETKEVWAKRMTEPNDWYNSPSDPIIVGNYIYLVAGKDVKKLDKETGEVIKIASNVLEGKMGFFSRMAYGEGKLFIPIGNGRMQCVDANTLESLWVSPVQEDNGLQAIAPAVYYDGYVYMGVSDGSASKGMFYALPAEDKDTSKGNEIQEYSWNYSPKDGKKGYYWSGGAIVGNTIVFAGEKGEIISHSLKENKVIDSFEINEAVRSSIHYDRELGRIYVSTKDGSIHSLDMNSDGTFNKTSHLKNKIGYDITSSPVTYNGRLYVAGGGMLSDGTFSVLDAKTLKTIYQIKGIHSQSSPILTTAYATAENKNTVYMYVLGFGENGPMINGVINYKNTEIYAIKDFEGNTEPIFEKIAEPSVKQYNSSSAAIDEEGSIYFKNDSNHLFKFSNTNDGKFNAQDVINAINNIPDVENITLNHEETIKNINDRYKALSDEEKAKVTNYNKLEAALQKIEDLKNGDKEVERLIAEIKKLPEVITIENKNNVNELYSSYMNLSDEHKAKITNAEKLLSAKKAIDALDEEILIKEMEEKIAALPELKDAVIDVENTVKDVYNQFAVLTKEQQDKVKNKEKLLQVKEKIEKTKAEVAAIDKEIWDKLDPKNITLKDKELVYSLIKRYEALDQRDQKHVEGYQDVLDAKVIIDKLMAENKPEDKPENKPENKPEDKPQDKPGNNGNNKPNTNTNNNKKPGNILPNTGGTNSAVVVTVAGMLIIAGGVLFIRKRNKA